MKSLLKTALFSIAIATLTGCATVPDAPKTQAEMTELGDDNWLNVPVDITSFTPSKKEIYSEEDKNAGWFGFGRDGDKGIITIFTDPKTGKTYDIDGQPVNEKGERILKNGYVCKVRMITLNTRVYVNLTTGDSRIINACGSMAWHKKRSRGEKIAILASAGAAATLTASILYGTTAVLLADMIEDDTL